MLYFLLNLAESHSTLMPHLGPVNPHAEFRLLLMGFEFNQIGVRPCFAEKARSADSSCSKLAEVARSSLPPLHNVVQRIF